MTDDIQALVAAELIKRRRMRESLLSFGETIAIPAAPAREGDWLDDALDRYSELDPEDASIEPPDWMGDDHMPLPGLTLPLHHRVLYEKVQECMEKPGGFGRLMVFMPPGAAKSTCATVVAPTWYMGKYPMSQIILASYATPIAKKLGGRGRMICDQKIYQNAFDTSIDKKSQAREMWSLTNGSEYMSGGLMSGLTGNRADGVIIDDPVKGREDAESKTIREKTLNAYSDDLMTRVKPGAWVILIQTRWAHEDLGGGILPKDYDGESGPIECRDGNVWEVLNIPAKCEREDDPLGREIGEYLWPEWFPPKHWQMYEPKPGQDGNGPSQRRWAALFQQRPRPDEGNMFEESWFNRYELGEHPASLNYYMASDWATQEDEGDNTEHGVLGIDNKGHWHFVDWFFGKVETDVGIDRLLNMAKKWKIKEAYDEKGILRNAIKPALTQRKKELGINLYVKYLHNAGSKASRAYAFQSKVHAGQVWIPRCPWGDRLIELLCMFPSNGIPDDCVDVCSLFGRGLEHARWSAAKVTKEEDNGLTPFTWEWLTYAEKKKGTGEKLFD